MVAFYKNEIARLNIPVVYSEADPEIIEAGAFDEIVMATGAIPAVPPIHGLKHFSWAEILLETDTPADKNVLVIGGGLIGIEIASKLADRGNRVTIVEMIDEIARGLEMIERNLTLKKLAEKQVKIYLKHTVTEVIDNTVFIKNENGESFPIQNIDQIVVATGMKSYRPFESKIPTHYVGDARSVAKAQEAIQEAYSLANIL